MMLGYLILLLCLISFIYFILDGIISPSEQMLVRMELLHTADEIEEKKHQGVFSGGAADQLKRIAYSMVNNAPRYTLYMLSILRIKLEQDKDFREAAEARSRHFDEIGNSEAKELRKHLVRQGDRILLWNSIGWFVFIIPIGLSALLVDRLKAGVKFLLTTPEKTFATHSLC